MFNISERRLAEPPPHGQGTDPDRRGAILEAVAFAAQRFLTALSTEEEEEVGAMLAQLGTAADVDRVAVYQNREGENGRLLLSCRYEWTGPGIQWSLDRDDVREKAYDPTLSRWKELLAAGEVIQGHVRDLAPGEAHFLSRQEITSIVVVPVFSGDHWWGAIGFGQCTREREWPPSEVAALTAAAGILGATIQQHRVAAGLRETEDRYRRLVEWSPDAIVVHRAGVITFANPAAAALLGASDPDDILGRSVLEFVHAESRPSVLERLQRLREGKAVPMSDEKLVRLDGGIVEAEVAATPFLAEGELAVQFVARDISARRRAEEAVRQSEARKTSMLQSAQDAVVTMDHDGRLLEFNPAAEEMFGRTRASVLGVPVADLLIPSSLRSRHRAGLSRYLATGETNIIGRRVETVAIRADGSEFPVELAISRVEVAGPALFTAYIRDITDRRRAEEALRESEDRYRRLVERSPDAIAVHSEGTFVFANDAAARLLGAKEPGELIGRPILDVVHPDYWEMVKERARQQTQEGVDVPLAEEKMVRLDGQILDVEVAGMPFTFEGKPAGQVVIRDITSRKRAEAALRQRGEYLAALHETALGLMSRLDVRELLEVIVTRAAALLDTPNGAIYLADPLKNELELHVGTGLFARWTGDRVKRGEGMLGRIWDSKAPSVAQDYATWSDRTPGPRYDLLRAGLAAPLTSASTFLGIIGVAHTDSARSFDEDDQTLLEQFARLASIALDNAQLYAQAQERLEERERAEQQLKETEAKYRTLVERIPAITYTAEFGETAPWRYVSPQIEAILGFTPEEWTVRPNRWSRQLHPDDRELVLADERRSQETGHPMLSEYRLFAKDGRVVWVRDESAVVRAGDGQPVLQGVMLDITERKRAEEQLREAEGRYRTLVEQIPAITYIDGFDESGLFSGSLYYSPQIEAILGYSPEELLTGGEPLWSSILHPEDREWVLAAESNHYRSYEPLVVEYRLRAKDGRLVWVLDEAVVVTDAAGRPRYSHGILYDVTDRKQVEEDLERALRIERQATERLRALDELKNTFLHAVSHELRTPLAAVMGFALTLERKEVKLADGERDEILRRLAVNARKLDQLLSDLLDLDRLDRGILEPRRRPTDMAALVRRVVEASEVLGTRPVRVEAQLVVAQLDGPKVERIVENLLVNAARHTPPECTIWVKVNPEQGGVLLAVEDEGPGVPEHLREAIFEAFRQGPGAPAHSPGVGIGLSLVAKFAELHGGRAWVEDRPGGGASFKVLLPGTPYFSTGTPTSEPYSVHEPS